MNEAFVSTPQLLTGKELASRLGVKATTVEQWRFYRKGPAYVRVGRAIRYRMEDVEEWLKNRRVVVEA